MLDPVSVAPPIRCESHSEVYCIQAESNDPVLASQAILFYRQLYDLEERGKASDAPERQQLRQREVVPIWNRIRCWLDGDAATRALPRSRIREAPLSSRSGHGRGASARRDHTLLFAAALRPHGVPHELHIDQHGDHGTGLIGVKHPWLSDLLFWLRRQEFVAAHGRDDRSAVSTR